MTTHSKNTATKATVTIVGAGIIGLNCAVELQSRGFQVTLIDKNDVGHGCSKGNAGHFATEQVFPLAEAALLPQIPKMLLDPLGPISLAPNYMLKATPWFIKFMANMLPSPRRKNTVALKAINKPAIASYERRLKAANAEHLMTCNGSLFVYEQADKEKLEADFQHYHQAGIAVEKLDRQQVHQLEPALHDNIEQALYFTEVAHTCDPYQVCIVLAEYAAELGVQFIKSELQNIELTSKQATIHCTNKTLNSDYLLLATGAWSKQILKLLGYKLPIEAERGYSLNLDQHVPLSRPVASADRKFIMTPMANGLRLSGTVEFAGLNSPPNYERATNLYHHAKHIVTDLAPLDNDSLTDEQQWMGCRPSLPDSLPVIGQAPKHERLYLALGHQHLGLTLGSITGELIGQLLDGESTSVDISPFSLARFN